MNDIDKERFGGFLLQLRREKNLTQKELAERLFVSDKAVSKWERGLSLPDVGLLLPMADCLGVTVTELLRGERTAAAQLPVDEVEALVKSTLQLTEEERQVQKTRRRKWRLAYLLCALVGIAECAVLLAVGFTVAEMGSNVLLVEGLCLLFGAWLCFRVKEQLPAYYDQNNISFYGDGVFRINLAGVRFHNGNWPYIIRAMRVWLLGLMVLFPVLWGVIHSLWPGHALTLEMPLTMICLFGMLIAAIVAGKRHE